MMDRRRFLRNLGIGAAVCAVVPIIDTHDEPFTVEKYKDACDELGFDKEKLDRRIAELRSQELDEEMNEFITKTFEFNGVTFHLRELKAFSNPSMF